MKALIETVTFYRLAPLVSFEGRVRMSVTGWTEEEAGKF